MLGNKKHLDVQFYQEVGNQYDDLDNKRNRGHINEYDELEQERKERELKKRLNRRF
jgi:nucleosome binding factor SPN SPT16 subunit